ncbi:hypothetical protein VN97_g1641 [Penicillium thymicola]|uniref:Uncharacterized protein n=1 Tax=Penicillium thymicola TaxID=293382 RepID=A0AAI9TQI1_PENTH|nr:hypothetical protein VN97_g1641 [Penicillium thymicola]
MATVELPGMHACCLLQTEPFVAICCLLFATMSNVQMVCRNGGVLSTSGLTWPSARKVSEVLQHDMENHHIYLNTIELHGIVHIS